MRRLILWLLLTVKSFCLANSPTKEPYYYILDAPDSTVELFENMPNYFQNKKHVKQYDKSLFLKWKQLRKFWRKEKINMGHYEKKESILIKTDRVDNELTELKKCREDLIKASIEHLGKIEGRHGLSQGLLTMQREQNPVHTLRLLHYLDDAKATAHCDSCILTCLYYTKKGLEIKINGKWISAPKLKKNQMLVFYGIPGELLSDGVLKAARHRVKCDERYAIAYFHNTPKDFVFPETEHYNSSTMEKVYQEVQLWYAGVNARLIRSICPTTKLSCVSVLYAWLAQRWTARDENPIAKKKSNLTKLSSIFKPSKTTDLFCDSKIIPLQ